MIRLAEAGDAERIGELWSEMVAYHAALDARTFRPAERGAELYARGIRDRLGDPQARILVVETDGEVVGYVNGIIADITTEMFMPAALRSPGRHLFAGGISPTRLGPAIGGTPGALVSFARPESFRMACQRGE